VVKKTGKNEKCTKMILTQEEKIVKIENFKKIRGKNGNLVFVVLSYTSVNVKHRKTLSPKRATNLLSQVHMYPGLKDKPPYQRIQKISRIRLNPIPAYSTGTK